MVRSNLGTTTGSTLTLIRTLSLLLTRTLTPTLINTNHPNPPGQARPDADLSKEGAALIEVVTKLIANHAGG